MVVGVGGPVRAAYKSRRHGVNTFDEFTVEGEDHGRAGIDGDALRLRAGARTDWFFKPDGSGRSDNIVRLVRSIDRPVFALRAKVSVAFAATYDAGALFIQSGEEHWGKLAFERSAGGEPTIVSVVTRGTSDDADGPVSLGDHVWLRLYCDGRIVAFHHSLDGEVWRFSRLFTLPGIGARPVRIGFGAQSPTGDGTTAIFSGVEVTYDAISNMRDGS